MPASGAMPVVPFISTCQMREVDRAMVEDYGILLVQMMENAGRALAQLARRRFLGGDPRGRKVVVLVGTGGNGGGGLVCARRLINWGADVGVWLSSPVARFTDVTRHQLAIIENMGVKAEVAGDGAELPPAELIVDALIGYSLSGVPRGASASLIRASGWHGAPVLALDVPSGVDAATGMVHEPAVRAEATLTLALPKTGLRGSFARERVGELYVADIGVPPGLYSRPSLDIAVGPVFAKEEIVRLW